MNDSLHPAQLQAFEKLKRLRVGALYIDRQEGKLTTASALVKYRLDHNRIDGVLWLCTRRRTALIHDGLLRHAADKATCIEVCGIETLSHNLQKFLELLQRAETQRLMLVIDNGLLIKNPDALRTKRVLALSEKCLYRLLISDMPFSGNIADMYAQWAALDWRILGYSTYFGFSINHVRGKRKPVNTAYLAAAIEPYCAQIKRESVQETAGCRELVWQFQLPPAAVAEYRAVMERFVWRAHGSNTGVYRLLQACQHVISGRRIICDYPMDTAPLYDDPLDNPRVTALLDVLTHYPQQRVLILCRYTYECSMLLQVLKDTFGSGQTALYSEKAQIQRRLTVMNIFSDEREKSRLATDVIVYYSNDWNWRKRQEKERQCRNALQGGELTVVSLVAADTIDYRILKCIWTKDTMTYAYDDAGNITSVSDGSKTISYEYDLLGQLTRVNDPYDTTAGSTGTTWKYAYDQGGNIQSKTAYAFTTGTVGSAVKTDSFTYGDTNWKDKLTAFNGTTITYDEIGNPTNDGTWNYTWIGGRQMRAMYKGEFGEQGYDEITFEYNENGLRTKKTRMYYDDATGDIGYKATNYTLHGKNIVHLSDGSNNLHFFYDAQNKPAVVIFNGTAYAYLYNLQGDVIGLVDSNGTKMVSYTYDAWGKPISKTGTLASTLGTIQPFRYRGYVYDEETGLYYLANRFYTPTATRFLNSDSFSSTGQGLFDSNSFLYCANNPVCRQDESGNFFNTICGAIVGAVVSAVTRKEGESLGEALLRGATTGAIAGAGLDICIATGGVGGMVIAGALGAAGSVLDTAWEANNNGENASIGDLIVSGVVGGGLNLLFGASGREAKRAVGKTVKEVFNAIKRNTVKSVSTRSGKVVLKKVIIESAKNLASSTTQGLFGKAYSAVGSKILQVFAE